MRVKTFRGKSMGAVLAQVKQELGLDAVILGNQTVRENGCSMCEVMAALDQPDATPAAPAAAKATAKTGRQPHDDAPPAPGPGTDWNREWDEIKGHLMALIRPRLDFDALVPRQRLALEFLEKEGVEETAILALFHSIVSHAETTVMPALSRMVRVKPLTPDAWPGMAHLFVGPSGVGKTTTILRLALAAREADPGRRVVVVNADGGRGKGRLILRHFAELSGIAYAEADGPEACQAILRGAAAGDAVYLDAPTFRREGDGDAWCRSMGLDDRKAVAAHLVLSPQYAPAQITHFLRTYRIKQLVSCIWTKLDEACNYGSLVTMAHASALPLSVLTFGPELTQGMAPASGKAVWKLIFKHQLPGEYPDCADAGV